MKTQIDKLVSLAEDYVKFAKEINLPDTHNRLRDTYDDPAWGKSGLPINVYLANDGNVWSVSFGRAQEVEIVGYSKSVKLPYGVTDKLLQDIINDARDFLINTLYINKKNHLVLANKLRLEKITSLKQELSRLEKEELTLKSE